MSLGSTDGKSNPVGGFRFKEHVSPVFIYKRARQWSFNNICVATENRTVVSFVSSTLFYKTIKELDGMVNALYGKKSLDGMVNALSQ